MRRRAFLQYSAAGLAATAASAAPKTPEWRNRQPRMEYRRLGRTEFRISAITFGTQQVRPGQTQPVEVALDMGLNYLDTAAAYGKGLSEEGLAPVIAGAKRDRVFLTTKIQPWLHGRNALFQKIFETLPEAGQKRLKGEAAEIIRERRALEPDYLGGYYPGQRQVYEASILSNVMEKKYGGRIDRRAQHHDLILTALDESLARLKTDHVDILFCPHGANSLMEVTAYPEMFEAFEKLRKQGKVRHFGVSAHSDPAAVLEGAVKAGVYSMAMVAYNVVNHEYVDKALDTAHAADLGVIAMKAARMVHPGRKPNVDTGYPVTPERLAKLEKAIPGSLSVPLKAYSWVLKDRRISGVNSEMTDVEMVRQNLGLVLGRG
jgi:aryl-alcohol dehydrogenase-like predicted oxidoreductase